LYRSTLLKLKAIWAQKPKVFLKKYKTSKYRKNNKIKLSKRKIQSEKQLNPCNTTPPLSNRKKMNLMSWIQMN